MRRTGPLAALVVVALSSTLLLAGCGSTASPAASDPDAAWNPPRPTGVPDASWSADFAADPRTWGEDVLAQNCGGLPMPIPDAALMASVIDGAPGSTAGQWTAFIDYVNTYMAPLCADVSPSQTPEDAPTG